MKLQEAINLSKLTGVAIQHEYFLPYEYIRVDKDDNVTDENGVIQPLSKYMESWKSNPYFQTGWEAVSEEKIVEAILNHSSRA
jgi:choline kinase